MRRPLCFAILIATTLAVVGCGFTADKPTPIAATGAGMYGQIKGGQSPVVGATVSVYALGIDATGPKLLASTLSDEAGNFAFNTTPSNTYDCKTALPAVAPVRSFETRSPHAGSPKAVGHKVSTEKFGNTADPRPAVLPVQTDAYLYIVATDGNPGGGTNTSIALAAGLGPCSAAQDESVEINEVTTVVFATLMRNFGGLFSFGVPSGDADQINAMEIADTNAFQTIIDLPSGTVKPNTVSTTGGTSITIEAAKIYSYANTIASCVNSSDNTAPVGPSTACTNLFNASHGTGAMPTDTFQAALSMAYKPWNNVTELFDLGAAKPPFTGGLASTNPPNDWTIGVSYSTPTMGLGLFPTPGGEPTSSNIDIDSLGRVWLPSNKSGASGTGYFDPTDNAFDPFDTSDFFANPEYVALDDPNQKIWVSDSAGVVIAEYKTSVGNEGNLILTIGAIGIDEAYSGPVIVNSDQSIVISVATSSGGFQGWRYDPVADYSYEMTPPLPTNPTGFSVASSQTDATEPVIYAATSDGANACILAQTSMEAGGGPILEMIGNPCTSGGIATAAYNSIKGKADTIAAIPTMNAYCSVVLGKCVSLAGLLNAPQGVAVDGQNQVWFANSGDGSLYVLSGGFDTSGNPTYSGPAVAYKHNAANGATMTAPVGIAIDRAGNIWTSNANCTSTSDTTCIYTLSEVFGAASPTYTPLSLQADRLQGTEPGTDLPTVLGTGSPRASNKQQSFPAPH